VKLPAHKAGFAGHLPAIHQTAGEKALDATPTFGFTQGREPVERQMDLIRSRQESVCIRGSYL